uniref:Uncharacterized protein n=1 Tax=Vitrella brassicaformis TaxID=1169539 RepID=A0A7S1KDK1_9ALVE|mmetsp:Transcript_49221/g.123372  ORF Transcript_49221/g.123372 Transcript_49221/m.123372 type:complete len:138 (+) Transcript_49221:785-1198(+)
MRRKKVMRRKKYGFSVHPSIHPSVCVSVHLRRKKKRQARHLHEEYRQGGRDAGGHGQAAGIHPSIHPFVSFVAKQNCPPSHYSHTHTWMCQRKVLDDRSTGSPSVFVVLRRSCLQLSVIEHERTDLLKHRYGRGGRR